MHRIISSTALLLAFATPSLAQTIDTVGGISNAPSRASIGKANYFGVDQSVLMLDYEMYLDVPGVETLTFFMYRHHSRSGLSELVWTSNVTVDGTGVGPAWYSAGMPALELICENFYLIGASWSGTVTYHYDTATTGSPVSFGSWFRGNTPRLPLPPTYNIAASVDIAQYHQRFTTFANPTVTCLGTGCANSTRIPRLVVSGPLTRGATTTLEVVNAVSSAPTYILFGTGVAPVPIPLFGCSLSISNLITTAGPIMASTAGEASLSLNVGNDPALAGFRLTAQSIVAADLANGVLDFTNGLELPVN